MSNEKTRRVIIKRMAALAAIGYVAPKVVTIRDAAAKKKKKAPPSSPTVSP
ncbi:MAG: hypothetical protein QF449_00380 [Alphaproteobacteria bacterium]|jgi:hypothetical protein|nr:hypothetical protein [Alphaproteobacteria bacterium]MDP6589462.1 hypothetical protein [Alphaproteobacteria bacterium]MDP6816478.1 hypothetical protein [Alphaproteobacteria bacterium]|tara:strand:- start:341 stop:493 length:153 start_codon:yes stop_codon:yes gene_type:complete